MENKKRDEAADEYVEIQMQYGTHSKTIFKRGWDSAMKASDEEVANLRAENARLKAIINRFKVYGTDGCKSCDTGRVTLFIANDECIECNPKSYEALKGTDR